jgi:hypothetical protein
MPIRNFRSRTGYSSARRDRERMAEEERMSIYTPSDLGGDWEFKIVRSTTGAFSREDTLNKLIAEEAQAGWTMVEKFDDARVRFKRPVRARANDAYLPPGTDPYRSYYGLNPAATSLILVAAVVLGAVIFLCVIGITVFLILQGGITH